MAKKFISLDRLSDYHTLLKEHYIESLTASNNAITPVFGDGDSGAAVSLIRYGVCDTAKATVIKEVTIPNVTSLVEGLDVFVKFTITNTGAVASLQLKVNNLDPKPIKRYGTTNMAAAGNLTAGMVCHFVYDGTNWLWVGHVDTNTTYSNASLGQGYGTCATAYGTVAKVVTLSSYTATAGGIVSVAFVYDVDANATMNINGKGAKPIFYNGAAIGDKVIKSGDIGLFMYNGTNYYLIAIDRNAVRAPTIGNQETINILTSNWSGDNTNGWESTVALALTDPLTSSSNYDIILDPANDTTEDAIFDNIIEFTSANAENHTITLTAETKPSGTLTFNVRVLTHDV